MVMVTGGVFQGKREYVKRRFGFSEDDMVNGAECDPDAVFGARCVYGYHELVRGLLGQGRDPVEFTERLCRENPGLIVIISEIGCGIIPLEKSDRLYREAVGRAGCIIAENSREVVRIFCGIPEVIKGK